ncbi:MAG: hypothetical protein JWO56_3791 [Acidobacteria bacterium]|nr:hypothetical protein [Acidobacteriota bacterium]
MDVPPLPLDILGAVVWGTNDDIAAVRQAEDELARGYDRGQVLYEAGSYRAAAATFMDVARAARPHDLLTANRGACYRNAAKAWSMAGLLREKRPLLDEAALEDPPAAADIRSILELLGEPAQP